MKIKMPQNRETITLEIEGMTCEGCATHIEKDMNATEGVLSSTVNHETGKGEFNFDADKMSKANVIDAINSVGDYSVVNNVDEEEVSAVNSKGQNKFDLIIIGGGSVAFSATIKAEGLGLTTLMVNAGLDFGGTCVNVGCVPSKNLIRVAETVRLATHSNFKGIKPRGADIDFTQIIKDKKALVASLQQQKYMDVVSDFKNLTMLKGWAEFVDNKTILVNGKDTYTATNIIIATGATTNIPSIEGLNKVGYLTNVSLFDLEEKPKSLTIMGAGYIGLEIVMAYNRLGVKVRIIEFTDRPLRSQTKDITDVLVEQMNSEGIEILPNFRAFKFEKKGNDTIIHCNYPDGSTTQIVEKGHIVVATGTKPNTSNLGLENISLKLTESSHIIVNEKMETNISNIYAEATSPLHRHLFIQQQPKVVQQ
nr:FAD-dependent oxidoreductase [Flavobacterium sp. CS20]